MNELALTYSVADQDFTRSKSLGVLNVSLELARHLARRPEISELHVLGNRSIERHLHATARIGFTSHDEATRGALGRILWDQHGLYEAARRVGHAVLLLPKGFAPFMRTPPVRLVTYIHDTMIHRYDRHYPDGMPLLERKYFNAGFRASLKHSSLILTNSEFTASEIRGLAKRWRLVVPPIAPVGIGISQQPPPARTKEERIVALASRLPHKRTDLALQYLARWTGETRFGGRIDWVGSLPAGTSFPALRNWYLHSRLPEEEYTRIVRAAKALVYFSEYEGFGMPPVEAAALGTAPVYSLLPATIEVMAGAGYGFVNRSYGSFAGAMTAAMKAAPHDVASDGRALLERHDWSAVVCRVISALREHALLRTP